MGAKSKKSLPECSKEMNKMKINYSKLKSDRRRRYSFGSLCAVK
jgi:hypothetical protein